MVATQSKRIIALEGEIMDLKEKLRLKEIEIKSIQLTEKARKEGTLDNTDEEEDEGTNEKIEETSMEDEDNSLSTSLDFEFNHISMDEPVAEDNEDILEVGFNDFMTNEVGDNNGN